MKTKVKTTISIAFKNHEKIETSDLKEFVAQLEASGIASVTANCSAGYPGNQMDHEEPSAELSSE